MNLKKVILIIIGFFASAFSKESFHDFLSDNRGGLVLSFGDTDYKDPDWIEYKLLRKDMSVKSANPNDLPDDFCDEACRLVDEFHRKTINQEVEWMLYFDYTTGEVMYCWKGEIDRIKGEFDEFNLSKKNIASIHSHSNGLYSFPSPDNFDILEDSFEDYEIITSISDYWIIEFKGSISKIYRRKFQQNLWEDISEAMDSIILLGGDKLIIDNMIENVIGNYLLNEINKEIKGVYLILDKRRYE